MIKLNKIILYLVLCSVIALISASCKNKTIPKPYGYFRVDLPEHEFKFTDSLSLPYTFAMNKIAVLKLQEKEAYWIDINYPLLNADIHCSYKEIKNDLYDLSEESRAIVYKHSVRADGITEKGYENPDKNVYGILYELKGNTASPLQFVLTDSLKHFFRAALYFNNVPNQDSIAPMADYIKKDIIYLIESFEWK